MTPHPAACSLTHLPLLPALCPPPPQTSRLDILREAELQRDLAIGCNSSLPVLAVVVDAQGHAVGFAMPLCEGNLAEIVYK